MDNHSGNISISRFQQWILYTKLWFFIYNRVLSNAFLLAFLLWRKHKTKLLQWHNILLKLPNTFHMTSETLFLKNDPLVKHRSSHYWLLKITPLSRPVDHFWLLLFSSWHLLPLSSGISLLSSDSLLLPQPSLYYRRPKATHPPVECRNVLEYLSSLTNNLNSNASFYNKSICLSPLVPSDQTMLSLQRKDWKCKYDDMFASQMYNIGLILYNLFNWWGHYHLPTSTVIAKPRKHVQA